MVLSHKLGGLGHSGNCRHQIFHAFVSASCDQYVCFSKKMSLEASFAFAICLPCFRVQAVLNRIPSSNASVCIGAAPSKARRLKSKAKRTPWQPCAVSVPMLGLFRGLCDDLNVLGHIANEVRKPWFSDAPALKPFKVTFLKLPQFVSSLSWERSHERVAWIGRLQRLGAPSFDNFL